MLSHGSEEAEKNYEQSDRVKFGNGEVGQTTDRRSSKESLLGRGQESELWRYHWGQEASSR